jgi:hypothetical protein
MTVIAKFKGKESILGYKYGQIYELILHKDWIRRSNGEGLCEYSTIQAFLEDWEEVKEV